MRTTDPGGPTGAAHGSRLLAARQGSLFRRLEVCKVRGLVHFSAYTYRDGPYVLAENMDLTPLRQAAADCADCQPGYRLLYYENRVAGARLSLQTYWMRLCHCRNLPNPRRPSPPTARGGASLVRGAILLLFLALAVRLAWVTFRAETGWDTIEQQWRDAAVGLFVGDACRSAAASPWTKRPSCFERPSGSRPPIPKTPALPWALRLVLDSSAMAFVLRGSGRMIAQPFTSTTEPSNTVRLDSALQALVDAHNAFEDRCHAWCLAFAARATQLAEEPAWWRLRAWLLFRRELFAED